MINNKYFSVKSAGIEPSGIAYQRPRLTGLETSYRTGDDYWRVLNMPYNPPPTNPIYIAELSDFYTLVNNNSFGNTYRFTDTSGNLAFKIDPSASTEYYTTYTIDHLTGLAWTTGSLSNNKTWNNAIDESLASTFSGFTDWYLPNLYEFESMQHFGRVAVKIPFILLLGARIQWTSTTDVRNSLYSFVSNETTGVAALITLNTKVTAVYNYYYCRQHF